MRIFITSVFLLILNSLYSIPREEVIEYIDVYKMIAVEEMQKYGIPASIKMAQAILESNAGMSDLATEANNHFGIKCGGEWNGPTYFKKDDDRDRQGRLI
ncbi:MAG TPA: glucosaminidase domain-containing protein, partial [Membranihabitans sp.]|nr:glucosaminidase domain-containing protein [Membranihabitans sp.]